MEELYVEGLATHGGPQPCVDDPRGRGEALAGARAGRAIEPRNHRSGVPTLSRKWKATPLAALSRAVSGPRAVREPGHVRNLHAREPGDPVPARLADSPGGPFRERRGGNPGMNEHGKSDRFVVPANPPNKAAAAEAGEERERAKGNTDGETRPGRSAGPGVSSELDRVREVARTGQGSTVHRAAAPCHPGAPAWAYWDFSPKAAPGVDGVTWASYGLDLEANLRDLHERVQQGRYRASPSRRVYIPKADGRLRPLGIATLEDKIVQRAVVGVLNAVYEADFRGFSYGFRPGRGPHQALDALAAGIDRKKGELGAGRGYPRLFRPA